MNSKLGYVVVFGGSFYTVARIFLHLAFEVDLECKWEFEAGHLVPAGVFTSLLGAWPALIG